MGAKKWKQVDKESKKGEEEKEKEENKEKDKKEKKGRKKRGEEVRVRWVNEMQEAEWW